MLVVLFFHMGRGKGDNDVWDEESLDHDRVNIVAFVGCDYLLDVGTSLHLGVDLFADDLKFSLDNVDVAVGETVNIVLGFELFHPHPQNLLLLLDCNVREKLVGSGLVWRFRREGRLWCC